MFEEIVKLFLKGRPFITSDVMGKEIGRRHNNMMRDIREEIKRLGVQENQVKNIFELSTYKDNGRTYDNYIIYPEGLKMLLIRYHSGYTINVVDLYNKLKI